MEYGVMVAQRILVPLIPVRIRIFQRLKNTSNMKTLKDIFFEPYREATAKDYLIASMPITVSLMGILALMVDEIVGYIIAVALLLGVAYLIRDLK